MIRWELRPLLTLTPRSCLGQCNNNQEAEEEAKKKRKKMAHDTGAEGPKVDGMIRPKSAVQLNWNKIAMDSSCTAISSRTRTPWTTYSGRGWQIICRLGADSAFVTFRTAAHVFCAAADFRLSRHDK